jgi:hypothetical protein
MRDLGHLEELSSTAALGLWADDVVIALDQAASDRPLEESSAETLRQAADTLEIAARRTTHPLDTPKTAHALAATDSALTVATALVQGQPGEGVQQLLESMSGVLKKAAGGQLGPEDSDGIQGVMGLFGLLGEHQLVASNSVLTSRKEARAWTGAPATSSFS